MRRKPSPPPCHRLSPPPSLLLALLAHRCCTHVPAPTATATTAKPLLVRENESRGLTVPGYHARAPRSAPPAVRDELGVLPEVRRQLEEALLLTPQTEGMKALRWRRQTMREHDGRPGAGTWSQLDAPRAPLVRPCRAAVLAPGPHAFLDPTSSCGDRRRRAVPKTWQVKVPD